LGDTINLTIAIDENVVVEFWCKLGVRHDAIERAIDALWNLSIDNTVVQLRFKSYSSAIFLTIKNLQGDSWPR
jgi:hypothetical protein